MLRVPVRLLVSYALRTAAVLSFGAMTVAADFPQYTLASIGKPVPIVSHDIPLSLAESDLDLPRTILETPSRSDESSPRSLSPVSPSEVTPCPKTSSGSERNADRLPLIAPRPRFENTRLGEITLEPERRTDADTRSVQCEPVRRYVRRTPPAVLYGRRLRMNYPTLTRIATEALSDLVGPPDQL